MQGTPWGLLELESNGSNVFQEVFHVYQVVPSLPHSCVFSCDFANWWLWTTCHREHNTSKQSKFVSFRLKVPNYVPIRSQHMKRQPYFGNTTTFCNNIWRITLKIIWENFQTPWSIWNTSWNTLEDSSSKSPQGLPCTTAILDFLLLTPLLNTLVLPIVWAQPLLLLHIVETGANGPKLAF